MEPQGKLTLDNLFFSSAIITSATGSGCIRAAVGSWLDD